MARRSRKNTDGSPNWRNAVLQSVESAITNLNATLIDAHLEGCERLVCRGAKRLPGSQTELGSVPGADDHTVFDLALRYRCPIVRADILHGEQVTSDIHNQNFGAVDACCPSPARRDLGRCADINPLRHGCLPMTPCYRTADRISRTINDTSTINTFPSAGVRLLTLIPGSTAGRRSIQR